MVVSPGIPLTIKPLESARKKGVSIIGEMELAFQLTPASVIAVTGSKVAPGFAHSIWEERDAGQQ